MRPDLPVFFNTRWEGFVGDPRRATGWAYLRARVVRGFFSLLGLRVRDDKWVRAAKGSAILLF